MSEEKRVGDGNTNAKKPRGPGKPFAKGSKPVNGFGARPQDGNQAGQRSKEVVATVAQARALYVQVLAEQPETEVTALTKLECIVRKHVKQAQEGVPGERESLFDRLWGKSAQPVTGADGEAIPVAFMFVPHVSPNTDDS